MASRVQEPDVGGKCNTTEGAASEPALPPGGLVRRAVVQDPMPVEVGGTSVWSAFEDVAAVRDADAGVAAVVS